MPASDYNSAGHSASIYLLCTCESVSKPKNIQQQKHSHLKRQKQNQPFGATISLTTESLTYRDAGVDIDAGNELVERIKPHAKATLRPEVLGNIGGFGALCRIPEKYQRPILVSGTDGVGTKLKLAIDLNQHKTVGIDLVAMCVNDLLAIGAEPLFFLDYYATASLDVNAASDVIAGIAEGCQQSGAALIGGETAEMPGMYQSGDYDLAGFCVGVVEESKIIKAENVKVGDQLIALGSTGAHSNGFSLIRKIVERSGAALSDSFLSSTLGEQLLEPTKIYVKSVLAVTEKHQINAAAHITGGGLTENIPRVLPEGTAARIDLSSWKLPPLFDWLQNNGQIQAEEMLRTFNCGVGMVIAVPEALLQQSLETFAEHGENAWHIGTVEATTGAPETQFDGVLKS